MNFAHVTMVTALFRRTGVKAINLIAHDHANFLSKVYVMPQLYRYSYILVAAASRYSCNPFL